MLHPNLVCSLKEGRGVSHIEIMFPHPRQQTCAHTRTHTFRHPLHGPRELEFFSWKTFGDTKFNLPLFRDGEAKAQRKVTQFILLFSGL